MKVLILGSGGREHAFAWKIAQSSKCSKLFVAPGNAGTAQFAENVDLSPNNFSQVGHFVIDNAIDLVLVGPEEPLVKGIRDFFQGSETLKHVHLIGPGQLGAQLEGSKSYAKNFMQTYGIPTAAAQTFTKQTLHEGIAYLKTQTLPIVLKADGLAAGKGVIISETYQHAEETLRNMLLNQQFGEASRSVVIEAFMRGIELSVFVLTDGESYKILPEAKDYKRIGEGDTGLNTGGMGALSPVPFATPDFMEKVDQRIIRPTIEGLKQENIDYVGFIFFGLMNVEGEPYVVEYNARMGDPENEVVMPRLKSDLLELMLAASQKTLSSADLEIDTQAAATVMLVSGGYPLEYEKAKVITGLEQIQSVQAFHAGTCFQNDNIVTNGGRVIALTALADNLKQALEKAQEAAQVLDFEGKYYRRDLGFDLSLE